MVALGYLIMGFWTLQFYIKKHPCTSMGIAAGMIYTLKCGAAEGNWIPLWFFGIFIFACWCVYYLLIKLDTWNNTTRRMRRNIRKQETNEELTRYINERRAKLNKRTNN